MTSAKGRQIGRTGAGRRSCDGRISYVQIEVPIAEGDEFGEPYVLTETDKEMNRLLDEHFAEDAK
jgi:hypothetical protein